MKKLSEEKLLQERERLSAMRKHEEALLRQGYGYVIGVDEAGRGPLCGPVAAAACILPPDCEILFLNDSKKLSEKKRELLFDEIREKALAYGIGLAEPARIDEINILNATFEAMRSAVDQCRQMLTEKLQETGIPEETPDPSLIVLVDGNKVIPGLSLPRAGGRKQGDPGTSPAGGKHYKGGRQFPVHCCSLHPGEGNQGPDDV